jgi:uncharacterized phage-associated protein
LAFHFIAIMSDYNQGSRIGWHYASEGKLDKAVINGFLSRVKKKCGNVQFGIHKLSTSETSWKSVKEKDKFFEDVIVVKDMDTFIDYISRDQELSAYDVAKLLLTTIPSSHLKLQKLLYYCYAEFLERTGQRLFDEPIVAYKYGPVVESVFRKFQKNGSSVIDYQEDEEFEIIPDQFAATPSFIKIAHSEHGAVAIDSIFTVLSKYGDMSPFDLVDKTHQEGGPWDRVYKPGKNYILTDELITQFHYLAK